MEVSTAYLPQEIFAPSDRSNLPLPRVFISPQRYIQGRGVLRGVGRYLSLMRAKRVALLISKRGSRNEGVTLLEGLRSAGIESVVSTFQGECSIEEITAHVEALSLPSLKSESGTRIIATSPVVTSAAHIPSPEPSARTSTFRCLSELSRNEN